MASNRLKYEFAHLGQISSAGYDPTYYDFTDSIEEPDNIQFTFGESNTDEDIINQLSSIGFQRSVSGDLEAFNELQSYLRAWLIDHEDASINSIIVQITDVLCGDGGKSMGKWQIVADNLDWCENGECRNIFDMTEYTPISSCLQQTRIFDNHRNFFPANGIPYGQIDTVTGLPILDTHLHPRFRYCDDMPAYLQNFFFVLVQGIFSGLFSIIGPILGIADAIQTIWNALFGAGTTDFADQLEQDITDQATSIMQNFLGCGRMHPAPLVRVLFENACSKCMDADGNRLTFESNIFNDPAGVNGGNLYNACLLSAAGKEGFRINAGAVNGDLRVYMNENRPIETALTLANSLKDLVNAKYILQDGIFKFNSKNSFPITIIYDFTNPSDYALVQDSICYSWNVQKKNASLTVEYAIDSNDQSGNNVRHRYNGQIDWATNNPRYEGIVQIKADKYGVARFANDGVDQKRIFSFTSGSTFSFATEWVDDVMLMQKDVNSQYKLLIWDGLSDKAEAYVVKKEYLAFMLDTGNYGITEWPNDWISQNIGTSAPYYIFNWPLYFSKEASDGGYPNIYDLHKIDDPTQSGLQNKSWSVVLDLCCSNLDRLIDDDVLGDGVFAHLDYLVKLPPTTGGLDQYGSIKSVTVNYKDNTITLRGEIKYTPI